MGQVAISVPEIGWLKEKAQPGHAEMAVVLKDDLIIAFRSSWWKPARWRYGFGDLQTQRIGDRQDCFRESRFQEDRYFRSIEARGNKGWGVSIEGNPRLGASLERVPPSSRATGPGRRGSLEFVFLDMAIDVDRPFGRGRALEGVSGRLSREGDIWRAVVLKSAAGDGLAPLELRIKPEGRAARRLHVLADDAGLALKTFGIYDDMIGGGALKSMAVLTTSNRIVPWMAGSRSMISAS